MTDNEEHLEEPISKSQRKRDMHAFKDMATRLTSLPPEHLNNIDPDIIESVELARKLTKGNARKRQIQFIAKQLSKIDTSDIQETLDLLDASSAAHVSHFHQLETWRERLIEGDAGAMDEIFNVYPKTDRQQLRALTRQAISEREKGEQNRHFRKLFKFLKTLEQDEQDH